MQQDAWVPSGVIRNLELEYSDHWLREARESLESSVCWFRLPIQFPFTLPRHLPIDRIPLLTRISTHTNLRVFNFSKQVVGAVCECLPV